jgi:hypothetical protein
MNITANSIIRKQHRPSANTVARKGTQSRLPTVTHNSHSVSTSITQKLKTKILLNSSILFPAIDGIKIEQIDDTADAEIKNETLKPTIITNFRLKDAGQQQQPENHFIFLVTILHILAYKDVKINFLKKLTLILLYLEENNITGTYTYVNIGNQDLFIQPKEYFKIAKEYNQQIYSKYFTKDSELKYNIEKNLTKEKALEGVTKTFHNDIETSLLEAPGHPHAFFSGFNKDILDDSFRLNGDNTKIKYISNTIISGLVQKILERYIKTYGAETYTKYTLKDRLIGGSKRKFKTKNKTDNKSKQSKTKKPKAMKKSKYYDPNTKRYVQYETALKRNLIIK